MYSVFPPVLVTLSFQTVVLIAIYLAYRRKAPTDERSFQAFRAVYVAAAILLTVGPLVAMFAMGRLNPYGTPFGPVESLTIVGLGTDAWVVGFILLLASFVGLRITNQMNVL